MHHIVLKKVVLQKLRDSKQEGRIEALSFEDIVHIGSVAIEFLCEPPHRASLPAKLLLNQISNMYHSVPQQKQREPLPHSPSRSWTTLEQKKRNVHAVNGINTNFHSLLHTKVSKFRWQEKSRCAFLFLWIYPKKRRSKAKIRKIFVRCSLSEI